MQVPDKDYLEYKRGMGKWTTQEELLWDFLSAILSQLAQISENLQIKKPEDELKTNIPLTRNSTHTVSPSLGMRPD